MREILFRGKRMDNGKWAYGSFIPDAMEFRGLTIEMPGFIRNYDFEHDSGCKVLMHEVDRETVGQFTGLTDKNGKKIFEGDTVKATDRFDKSIDYFVEFKNGAFMLKQKGVNYHIYFNDLPEKYYRLEVIGNIHDNPELLEAQS